jgi:transcriptional antiterminator NusG
MPNYGKPQWFVVQTLSGQEYRVQEKLLKQRTLEGLDDRILCVEVPTEKVSEVRRGKKTTTNRKFFPGYILVQMSLFKEDGNIDNEVWYFVREMQGVIGFIGGDRPVPISESEMENIMAQTREEEDTAKPKVQFQAGETVTIRDGAFENFEGVIESVDPDRGKLRLSVSIFGRATPVEVEYWQVAHTT